MSSLVGVEKLITYSSDSVTVTLANTFDSWTTRIRRFFATAMQQYSPLYRCPPAGLCKNLEVLSEPIPTDDEEFNPSPLALTSSHPGLAMLSPDDIAKLPVVYTDGGCVFIRGRVGSYGVYWGPDSPENKSGLCTYPPFTNQRAELEAIMIALITAVQLKLAQLVLCSDSAYAITCINHYSVPGGRRSYRY